MSRLKLKDIYSADAPDGEPALFAPADPECCCLWVQAFIGPDDEPGDDTYQLGISTPRWLATEGMERGYEWGRFLLIVPRWDYDLVLRAIAELLAEVDAPDWRTASDRLARYAWAEWDSIAYGHSDRDPVAATGEPSRP